MTAPEPPEVQADELAAAERLRYLVESGRSPTLPLSEARALLKEYDRRGALLAALMDGLSPWLRDGEPPAPDDDEIRASVEQMNADFTEDSNGWALTRADLARTLPVVEAAGAYIAHLDAATTRDGRWLERNQVLLDALARAVHAAREPRTGEQG